MARMLQPLKLKSQLIFASRLLINIIRLSSSRLGGGNVNEKAVDDWNALWILLLEAFSKPEVSITCMLWIISLCLCRSVQDV